MNHFKWIPLIVFQIKKYNSPNEKKKKKFLVKEMVYFFIFTIIGTLTKICTKFCLTSNILNGIFFFTDKICFNKKYFRNLSFKFQMIFRLRIQIKLKSDR